MTTQSKREEIREQIRGLFVLGLLAVLIVVRYQTEKLMVTIGQSSVDFIPVINLTITLLSLYAFFMILGVSDDVIGKSSAEMFRNLAKYCLKLDFILSAFLGILYFISGYSIRALWIIALIGSSILVTFILSLRKIKFKKIWKRPEINRLRLLKMFFICLCLISVTLLFFYPEEQYFVIFFVLGFGSFLVFALAKEKQSKKRVDEKSNKTQLNT